MSERNSKRIRDKHNEEERKRRDLIKHCFANLKDAVPTLRDEKPVSRAKILRKAAEYIQHMKAKNKGHQEDIDSLNRKNAMLVYQINQLQRIKDTRTFTEQHSNLANLVVSETDNSDASEEDLQKSNRTKEKKVL
ncbi:unnamed protein product [Macrosiphum euphorbiae]|uniref:BHLH domain-containing protein n=1 Tax=Macrosiphum euphorbiae TaxID=13131 RepID=A0AAV0XSR6_9HEMI|nr:unnamed protein product [Macrosiphum euphorbiae]